MSDPRDRVLAAAIERGLRSGASFATVREALLAFRDSGGNAEGAMAVLETLRGRADLAAHEDDLLDVMDVVVGWCSPHVRVW